jgi:glycerol-3-phosphate acyltransferase PlsX
MVIGIDMMGGDYAPVQAVKGVKAFQDRFPTTPLCLFGDEQQLLPLLQQEHVSLEHATVVHAPEQIGMHEHPTKALKEKPNSSIAIGFAWLSQGKIDSFMSAGNTGAMLVGTHFSIKALEGVIRPTISTIIPKADGSTALLLDVGLNADCKPELLNQFAIMGSVYASVMLGIDQPSVGLINVGEDQGQCPGAGHLFLAKRKQADPFYR